jgi:hypothetical protein
VAIGGADGSSLLHPTANAPLRTRINVAAAADRLRDEEHFMSDG